MKGPVIGPKGVLIRESQEMFFPPSNKIQSFYNMTIQAICNSFALITYFVWWGKQFFMVKIVRERWRMKKECACVELLARSWY